MLDSDDSDFYGDEVERDQLQRRVDGLKPAAWWRRHAASASRAERHRSAKVSTSISHLHNPYAGVAYAWQLTETVNDFLSRLPPTVIEDYPWIYICNPYIARKPKEYTAKCTNVVGCEDEGPCADGSDLATLMEGGMERLHMVSRFIDHLRNMNRPQSVVTQELRKASFDATEDILDLAQHLRVTCGKWMIFCTVSEVDAAWDVIAKATANNELGIAAKVASKLATRANTEHLICVYTADFNDKQDVKRVASALHRLGFLPSTGKPLYYKPDVYTYLGISSQNPWGIKASIYDSRIVLKEW